MQEDFDRRWLQEAAEVLTGMKEWRLRHPRATLREIEEALDERRGKMRARMLEDVAQASADCRPPAAGAEKEELGASSATACPTRGASKAAKAARSVAASSSEGRARKTKRRTKTEISSARRSPVATF